MVVYPAAPEPWDPNGVYFENLVVYAPVKLQGVGPGGVWADATLELGSVLDGRGVAGDTAYAQLADAGRGLTWDGNQTIYEGPVVYVLASDGEFTTGFKPAIDGFTIQGGDQQGFPNLQPVDPGVKDFVAVQGGGIFANAYARYLQITNNIIRSNAGAYAAPSAWARRLAGANDNQNDVVHIANNRILTNGGTQPGRRGRHLLRHRRLRGQQQRPLRQLLGRVRRRHQPLRAQPERQDPRQPHLLQRLVRRRRRRHDRRRAAADPAHALGPAPARSTSTTT